MPRYIDADKALEEFDEWIDTTGALGKGTSYYYEARACIEDVPTADVVEVRYGKWIYHECVSSYDGAISGYSCSECCAFIDEDLFDSYEFHKDFCGHCGARMDGERE